MHSYMIYVFINSIDNVLAVLITVKHIKELHFKSNIDLIHFRITNKLFTTLIGNFQQVDIKRINYTFIIKVLIMIIYRKRTNDQV